MTQSRRMGGVSGVAALMLVAGCSFGDADPEPARTVTVTPSPSPTPTSTLSVPELHTVDPSMIDGFDIRSHETLDDAHHTYQAIPVIPNADALTTALEESVGAEIADFRAHEQPVEPGTIPELTVSWDLVGASPDMIGVRLTSAENGGDGFDGRAQTWWYSVADETIHTPWDLIAQGQEEALLSRVEEAAEADPRVDVDLLLTQLEVGDEAFDSLAFTDDEQLWIEFDRAQVSHDNQPIAVAVSPEGLLSDLGEMAFDAAFEPSDPGIVPATPSATESATSQSEPTAPAESATSAVDCSAVPCMALTFDDGPVEGTNDLLDVLAEKGVKATFFMVGTNVDAHPDIVARMHAEGHVLGNHTMDHPQLTRLDEDAIRNEIEGVNDLIEEAAGVRSELLRPPYGATNGAVASVAADLGMAQILWDVDPEDWKDKNSDIVTERVDSHAHNGAIVLSHDIHETTRDAYGTIIDNLRDQGYTLVTVPELIGDLTPGEKYFNRP